MFAFAYIQASLVILLISTETGCQAYRILFSPVPTGSHLFSEHTIARELARRGNEVHMLLHWSSILPRSDEQEGGRDIVVHRYGNSKNGFDLNVMGDELTMDILEGNVGWTFFLKKCDQMNTNLTKDLYYGGDKLMETLENLKFDIAVVEYGFYTKLFCILPLRLKIPYVIYSDVMEHWLVRVPWLPSFFTPLSLSTDKHSTFYSRLRNTLLTIKMELLPDLQDPDIELLKEIKIYSDFKSVKEIIANSRLYLVTDHPVLEVVRPVTANVIQIGGLTTEPWLSTPPPLPDNFKRFIEQPGKNSAANVDAVVVSFGSHVPDYPEYFAKSLIEAFSQLPQYRFLWRFKNSLKLSIPSNVMITDWLPQKELLSHPFVKLFITHSGNNGQFEAVYHAVPMLAVPLYADQHRNAMRIVERGYGEEIDFTAINVKELVYLIHKIINDPSYKVRIKKASEIYRSQPQTPSQRAAYWIEHVIKFGSDHLRPAGNDLYFWQYLCLDVLLFMQAVLLLSVTVSVFCVRAVYRKICPGPPNTKSLRKKNN